MNLPQPDPLLTVRLHDVSTSPALTALCVGFERGEWRYSHLAAHLMEWLPEFALTASECEEFGHQNAVKLIREAARRVYTTEKFKNRGEFGEILLHVAIRQTSNTFPAVSKIYYKSANNDTVKGFDAVHVVQSDDGLELWLGEAKFYDDISRAISDVVSEIKLHTETDYLRDEFALIVNKIDPRWPNASVLRKLLQPEVSLDDVFERACIPVLLTYDSTCVGRSKVADSAYVRAFEAEVRRHFETFKSKDLPKEIRIHLFLVPLHAKAKLVAVLDEKLKALQHI
jgi:hypothetical protein